MNKVYESPGAEVSDSAYNTAVGSRLREIRHQKRLTQHDVQRLSGAEFKASVLGAYERGERALSLPRLERLAKLYHVPVEDLLPAHETVITDHRLHEATLRTVVLDLQKLNESQGEAFDAVKRFVTMIQVQRQDFNGRLLSIRHFDERTLAAMLDVPP